MAGKRKLLAASAGTPSSANGTRSRASVVDQDEVAVGEKGEAEADGHPVDGGEEGDRALGEAVEESDEALARALDGGTRGDGRHFRQVLS